MPTSRPRSGSHARRVALRASLQGGVLIAVAAIAATTVLLRAHGQRPSVVWLTVAGALVALGAARLQTASRWRTGRRSERLVARRLRRLQRRGWVIVNDVDRGRGNVDHLAIGPRGVFAIETKTTRRGGDELAQARANAAWAARRLGVAVTPVLCVAQRDQRPHVVAEVLCVDARRLPRALARHSHLAALNVAAVTARRSTQQ